MRCPLPVLEEPYRSRAVPGGSGNHLSWLFAAREARDPLLGIYALTAEWRALLDPATDSAVAGMKLSWWREETGRLATGSPMHPVTRFLAGLPHAAETDFGALQSTLDAVAAHMAGVPLERGADLEDHAAKLLGIPLLVAAQLAGTAPVLDRAESAALRASIDALAVGNYLAGLATGYRREAQAGRIAFAIDELLAAHIENDDLIAEPPPPRLAAHLADVRARSAERFAQAARRLPRAARARQRHVAVLAVLGARRVSRAGGADFPLADLYNAWNAARRAAQGR